MRPARFGRVRGWCAYVLPYEDEVVVYDDACAEREFPTAWRRAQHQHAIAAKPGLYGAGSVMSRSGASVLRLEDSPLLSLVRLTPSIKVNRGRASTSPPLTAADALALLGVAVFLEAAT